MFFNEDLVKSKRFKNVWLAAHNQKADANDVNIPKVCNSISKLMDDYSDYKLRHLSFRTAYTLFHGTVKTYKEQVDQLCKDAFKLSLEMEFGTSNVGATGDTSYNYPADGSSDEEDEELSNCGDKETSINIGDPDDNEEEMNSNTRAESEQHFDPGEKETSFTIADPDDNEEEMIGNTRAESEEHFDPDDKETSSNIGDPDDNEEEIIGNTRAESEEYFDPGDKETSSNIGDPDDNEEALSGNTRAGARRPSESSISNVTRQLSPVIGLSRTTNVNHTAKDIRSPRKRKSDGQGCHGEGSSNMAARAHRPKVKKTNQEVQTNKSFIKNQKLRQLYRRKDPVFDNGLPLAKMIIYAAGSRRPVKTIWSNVNPDVMKL